MLELALLFVAIAIAGACAFVIFWPLALVHMRGIDRTPRAVGISATNAGSHTTTGGVQSNTVANADAYEPASDNATNHGSASPAR